MIDAPFRALPVWLLALALSVLLPGCDRDRPDGAAGGDAADAAGTLPRPEAGAGSVTGMPGARAGDTDRAPIAEPATDPLEMSGFDADGNPVPGDGTTADAAGGAAIDPAGLPAPVEPAPVAEAGPTEPGADDAAAVVRRYYGAIDARQYDQAYQLWSGDGRSSGQSAASFAGGFEQTAGVTVQTGTPGRVEGAAGSRYVRIPVSIRAVQVDGSEHRYEGSYTLRRAVVDGASDAQREWRIEGADLREVQ